MAAGALPARNLKIWQGKVLLFKSLIHADGTPFPLENV
jgi:hypothetical protein